MQLQPATAQNRQAQAVALSARQIAAVDQGVLDEMERQQAVGVAVGVIQNGRIVYLNGYGWADREKQVPVTANTLFRWASISKTLTAVTALQLVEQGKLDLSKDVREYVPEFPDKGVTITANHLLSHQSGIVHYSNGKVVVTPRQYDVEHPFEDVVVALDKFKHSPLLFAPGEKLSYSSHSYILLSAVVQRAGGEKFADQVRNRIARPLEMATLQPDYPWVENPHRVVGYTKKGGQVVTSTDTDVSWKLGGGGYMSNIEDLARFAQGLLSAQLLSKEARLFAWQPQKTALGEITPWGFGFTVSEENGELKVFHEGYQEKARCRMVIYPRRGSAVVVMSNSEYVDPAKFSTAIFRSLKVQ